MNTNWVNWSVRPDTYWPCIDSASGSCTEAVIAVVRYRGMAGLDISVYAARKSGSIEYRIVDDEGLIYTLPKKLQTSDRPLSLYELFELLDSALRPGERDQPGILGSHWKFCCGNGDAIFQCLSSIKISSGYYQRIRSAYRKWGRDFFHKNRFYIPKDDPDVAQAKREAHQKLMPFYLEIDRRVAARMASRPKRKTGRQLWMWHGALANYRDSLTSYVLKHGELPPPDKPLC